MSNLASNQNMQIKTGIFFTYQNAQDSKEHQCPSWGNLRVFMDISCLEGSLTVCIKLLKRMKIF